MLYTNITQIHTFKCAFSHTYTRALTTFFHVCTYMQHPQRKKARKKFRLQDWQQSPESRAVTKGPC